MKIRITGTKEELIMASTYYRELEKDDDIKYVSVSHLYQNRGSTALFRLYVDIEYHIATENGALCIEHNGE